MIIEFQFLKENWKDQPIKSAHIYKVWATPTQGKDPDVE